MGHISYTGDITYLKKNQNTWNVFIKYYRKMEEELEHKNLRKKIELPIFPLEYVNV